MHKSLIIISIFTIAIIGAGIFVFPNVHDVSACPNKQTGAALNIPAGPSINNINTLLAQPSSVQPLTSQTT
jgi:hypothetical protein